MWSNYRRLTSPSFRTKVFLASFICIGIPVILSLSLYTYLTRDAVEEQALLNAKKELNLVEENVSRLLEDLLNVSNFVQIDSELNTILKRKSKDKTSNFTNLTYDEYMEDSLVRRTIENITLLGEKSYVTILLENGKYYTNYAISDYNPQQIFQEEWFEQLRQLSGYQSLWIGVESTNFKPDIHKHPYQISVARTLRDTNQRIYGYVVVTLLETKIREILQNQNETEHIYLIDNEKKILSTKNSDEINHPLPFSSKLVNQNDAEIIKWHNRDYLISMKTLSFNGWSLVSIIPYKNATSNITSVFSDVFLLLFISFLLFFIILAYLMNRITRPLTHLNKVVKQVQEGDLSVRADVTSNDEIGKFSMSLNEMINRVNRMIVEVKHTQLRKRQAELAMLQAQINPHFLFNVLNSIRMKILKFGDKDSAKMIQSLSTLLRWTIDTKKDVIPFEEEINLIEDYVNLMNMRQKNKIQLITNVTEATHHILVPRFILQPLIENSIIHGLIQSAGIITLEAKIEENKFIISVKDSGVGMNPSDLSFLRESLAQTKQQKRTNKGFSSIGISNVFERLQLYYQNNASIQIESIEGKGTETIIQVIMEGDSIVQSDVS
ncbi:two-component system, sensor histidine kinase YesM [Gracilibacillus ureilyticus]|uniref:Two-component system, sensor histidine kinase YesM n=1 Tax=Gracilibacillus ureilyticus TaxID=531814 RepID=A0A1H9PMP1_9BACI|nr:histidine kinase [Gracilibacillus ureilyticus]SER49407.1 two-component system, sensor histidine kinase YesM [Gracilibacillus ureilyticus]